MRGIRSRARPLCMGSGLPPLVLRGRGLGLATQMFRAGCALTRLILLARPGLGARMRATSQSLTTRMLPTNPSLTPRMLGPFGLTRCGLAFERWLTPLRLAVFYDRSCVRA
jgi:hypothetical protein